MGRTNVSEVSAWKELFLKHGPLFTSVASLAIALMAFFLTIYNARLDRRYKELSIKPALHLHVETSDFHVGLVNAGLGPAEIISVATKFETDKCVIYKRKRRFTDEGRTSETLFDGATPIGNYFGDPLGDLMHTNSVWEPSTAAALYVRTLTPGQVIPPGQEENIFELQKQTLEIVQRKLQALNSHDHNDIIRRFITRAQSIPYYVHFCSLTGEYCVNEIKENCG